MASRVIGLDVGTHAVRAAEVLLGRDQPTLTRFGQVTLPYGAVRDGEVVDAPAVSAALRRLWAEAGFRGRDVVVGVGNQRVIVRQAELPELSEDDLRSALQYEVQDLIPMPVEDAILDVQVLDRYANADHERVMKILLVAAQRDMVRSLLAALDGAGLSAASVDVVPLGLLRTLGVDSGLDPAHEPAEAIVSIGAGVTNVVVHEGGAPRFVRMLMVGGNSLTEALADELAVDLDAAEDLKRRACPEGTDDLERRATRVVDDRLTPLLEEIRGSLDYYLSQPDAEPVARVLLTGGGSRQRTVAARLEHLLNVPVVLADPLAGIRVARTGLTPAQLDSAAPLLAAPIGFALSAGLADNRHRLTLLPQEVAAVRRQRRHAVLAAGGVAALAAVLVGVWATQGSQVAGQNTRAAQAEALATRLEGRIGSLKDSATLEAQLQERRNLVTTALEGDVAWSRLLQDMSGAMPQDMWLTAFNGTRSQGAAGGSITVNAMGFDHTTAARWLLAADQVPSLAGPWVPSSTQAAAGERPLVSFQSTATITPRAGSDRAARYLEESP